MLSDPTLVHDLACTTAAEAGYTEEDTTAEPRQGIQHLVDAARILWGRDTLRFGPNKPLSFASVQSIAALTTNNTCWASRVLRIVPF